MTTNLENPKTGTGGLPSTAQIPSSTTTNAERQEFLDRLRAMVEDRSETWDLSPADQAAIKFALAELGRVCVANAGMLEALERIGSDLSALISQASFLDDTVALREYAALQGVVTAAIKKVRG